MLQALMLCVDVLGRAVVASPRWSPELEVLLNAWRSPEAELAARSIEGRLFFDPILLREAQRAVRTVPRRRATLAVFRG